MPYVPNARMDRCESPENVFTLKYFCNFINSLNFDEVRISDPHSNVSEALINRVTVERGSKIVSTRINFMNNYLEKENLPPINLLFFPDEGAMKRYSKDCDQPFAFGIKKRDWDTGAIVDYKVEGDIPAGSNILIVDDICSYGGTFYNAAKILKEKYKANKVYLFVTHCENSVLLGKLSDTEYVDHVFTTRTIFTEKSDFVTVI
jgi:ribose-phosphate pyrophosphokinase